MKDAHILVVEDNETISELIRCSLMMGAEKDGREYEITLAYDGVQGIEQAWKLHPDVIVLDIQMPRLDGYGMLKSLRSSDNTTPVIIITATPHQQARINSLLAGYDAYITKPFAPSLLYRRIRDQLHDKAHIKGS